MATVLDREGSKYLHLYDRAKRLTWDPAAIDLTRDVSDWAMIRRDYPEEQYAEQIHRLCSLFWEGEESVTSTLAPLLAAIPRAGLGVDKEMFLTSQVFEEAKHFEFFERYFREVLSDPDSERHLFAEPRAVLIDDLDAVTDRVRRTDGEAALREALVAAVTHYMGVVEAMLARTGYRGVGDALAHRGWLPGLQEGFRLIRRDEGRHVAFGVYFVREMVAAHPELGTVVETTLERQLPNVIATVRLFDYPQPIAPVEPLLAYAMEAAQWFLSAAGGGNASGPDPLTIDEDVP